MLVSPDKFLPYSSLQCKDNVLELERGCPGTGYFEEEKMSG
jgi:hypothetical protein